jgi:hypothetical protein
MRRTKELAEHIQEHRGAPFSMESRKRPCLLEPARDSAPKMCKCGGIRKYVDIELTDDEVKSVDQSLARFCIAAGLALQLRVRARPGRRGVTADYAVLNPRRRAPQGAAAAAGRGRLAFSPKH